MFLGSCVLHYLVILLIATIFTCIFFNIILLRYADDTTLMAESEEELKSLLMTVKVEISPGISLEGMMLKLKLQYFGHLM